MFCYILCNHVYHIILKKVKTNKPKHAWRRCVCDVHDHALVTERTGAAKLFILPTG